MAAAGNRHLAVATLLVDRTPDLGPALAEAAGAGFLDLVKRLLARKASPDAVDRTDASALERAARAGHLDVVATLLDAGASVTVHGVAALHAAAGANAVDVVARLLGKGVPVDARDPSKSTPLLRAAGAGSVEVVALLLARGADPRAVDAEGRGYAVYMEARQSFYTAELDRLSRMRSAPIGAPALQAGLDALRARHAQIRERLAAAVR